MNPIMAAMQGIQAVGGIAQMIAGSRILRRNKLPEYEIPQEYGNNIALADTIRNMGMPKEEYQQGLQNIQRNAAFGIGALQNRRGGLAGIGNIVQRSNDATLGLDARAAQMRNSNMIAGTQMKAQANQMLALQKLAKQQWEKQNPYLRKLSEGQALVGAGMQNLFGAAKGVAQGELYKDIYGQQGGGADYSAYEFDSNKLTPATVRR